MPKRTLTADDLKHLPNDMIREISRFHPLLIPPFTNDALRRAVRDYLTGGELKDRIVTKYGEISNWDTSRVTSMFALFSINIMLSSMHMTRCLPDRSIQLNMIKGAKSFNKPLNNWDVSKVKNMDHMFCGATSFNQPLDKWNVSNVETMEAMFHRAKSFNQPLHSWDVSKVKDMKFVFACATSFNQPLNSWDVSNVENMSFMFQGATTFNQPLNSWDVQYGTCMFSGAISFNQPLHAPWYEHYPSSDSDDY